MTPLGVNPFARMDARTLIDAQARHRATHPCLIWEPFEGAVAAWNYRQFGEAVRRFAAGLHLRSIGVGDRVIVHLENSPEFLIAWLGCGYAGALAVTTNARLTKDELAYVIDHCGATAAITQPSLAATLADARGGSLRWIALTETDAGNAPATVPPGFDRFASIDGDPATMPDRPHDPDAPFAVQYTSGTTSRPKAVLWSHANFLWGAQLSAMHEALTAADVHLIHLPLFHCNAQIYSFAATFWAGGTAVLQPRFSASRFWPVSVAHGCTWSSMVPFCVAALATQPRPPVHAYRHWGNGVCDMPSDAHFGVKTIGWWGMTETITQGIVGTPFRPDAFMAMGRPSPGYGIVIVDESDRPVGVGETGQLLVRGVRGLSLFQEYLHDPAATAGAFRDDGLFITGDRVTIGEHGLLYFADRANDVLKVGGENVSALEVERVAISVEGVSEAAVVGAPDAMLGEVPIAFVLGDPARADELAAAVTAACANALARFKQPHRVVVLDQLPRAALNKVAKATLRTIARDLVLGPRR